MKIIARKAIRSNNGCRNFFPDGETVTIDADNITRWGTCRQYGCRANVLIIDFFGETLGVYLKDQSADVVRLLKRAKRKQLQPVNYAGAARTYNDSWQPAGYSPLETAE